MKFMVRVQFDNGKEFELPLHGDSVEFSAPSGARRIEFVEVSAGDERECVKVQRTIGGPAYLFRTGHPAHELRNPGAWLNAGVDEEGTAWVWADVEALTNCL